MPIVANLRKDPVVVTCVTLAHMVLSNASSRQTELYKLRLH